MQELQEFCDISYLWYLSLAGLAVPIVVATFLLIYHYTLFGIFFIQILEYCAELQNQLQQFSIRDYYTDDSSSDDYSDEYTDENSLTSYDTDRTVDSLFIEVTEREIEEPSQDRKEAVPEITKETDITVVSKVLDNYVDDEEKKLITDSNQLCKPVTSLFRRENFDEQSDEF